MPPQLGVTGEIGFTRGVAQTRHFVFPVSRPGSEITVDVNIDARSAVVSRRTTGILEALAYLHKMAGAARLTSAWTLAMDVLSAGLVVMVLGSYYMWFRFKRRNLARGIATLVAGYACCAMFLQFMWL